MRDLDRFPLLVRQADIYQILLVNLAGECCSGEMLHCFGIVDQLCKSCAQPHLDQSLLQLAIVKHFGHQVPGRIFRESAQSVEHNVSSQMCCQPFRKGIALGLRYRSGFLCHGSAQIIGIVFFLHDLNLDRVVDNVMQRFQSIVHGIQLIRCHLVQRRISNLGSKLLEHIRHGFIVSHGICFVLPVRIIHVPDLAQLCADAFASAGIQVDHVQQIDRCLHKVYGNIMLLIRIPQTRIQIVDQLADLGPCLGVAAPLSRSGFFRLVMLLERFYLFILSGSFTRNSLLSHGDSLTVYVGNALVLLLAELVHPGPVLRLQRFDLGLLLVCKCRSNLSQVLTDRVAEDGICKGCNLQIVCLGKRVPVLVCCLIKDLRQSHKHFALCIDFREIHFAVVVLHFLIEGVNRLSAFSELESSEILFAEIIVSAQHIKLSAVHFRQPELPVPDHAGKLFIDLSLAGNIFQDAVCLSDYFVCNRFGHIIESCIVQLFAVVLHQVISQGFNVCGNLVYVDIAVILSDKLGGHLPGVCFSYFRLICLFHLLLQILKLFALLFGISYKLFDLLVQILDNRFQLLVLYFQTVLGNVIVLDFQLRGFLLLSPALILLTGMISFVLIKEIVNHILSHREGLMSAFIGFQHAKNSVRIVFGSFVEYRLNRMLGNTVAFVIVHLEVDQQLPVSIRAAIRLQAVGSISVVYQKI